MANQGHGHRGRPRDSSQPPPGFDQEAFMEAMGAAFTTISYTRVVGDQEGSSDLQWFRVHHPLTSEGGGETQW